MAAKLAATVSGVCTDWNTAYTTRLAASNATVAFTKNSSWTWDGIQATIATEQSAIQTETGVLDGLITRASVKSDLQAALQDYRAKLTAYSSALQADNAARGTGTATWERSNPASDALAASARSVRSVCNL
ncbi:hypothetical protein GCM10023147_18130 [Tsukamurella soli]|uniref:Uncharacterized protein n=1 Tax=Tsukamurella soli TaxID=644556 RepID=A0ABP8JG17_9ACTN